MFAWHPSLVETSRCGAGCVARFAVRQSAQHVTLDLRLHADPPIAPDLEPDDPTHCRLEPLVALGNGDFRVTLVVEPPADPERDDEVTVDLTDRAGTGPACRIILRRSTCTLATGLLEPDGLSDEARRRWAHTEAALRWFGWNRFRELVGIKRFSSGRSGKDVVVFRPRLRAPDTGDNPLLATSHPGDVLDGTWGTWLLVKSGERDDVAQEWERFQTFLRDQLHPFLARSEALLAVRAPGDGDSEEPVATLVSSFLGGDLVRTETLEDVIKGAADFESCRSALDRALDLLAPWHAAARPHDLGCWRRVYHPGPQRLLQKPLAPASGERGWGGLMKT